MLVETRGLDKRYDGVPALKDVSLAAREGEVAGTKSAPIRIDCKIYPRRRVSMP